VAQKLKNLEEFSLEIYDYDHGHIDVPTWINFVHSIPNLKSLKMYLYEFWCQFHEHLFEENKLPHLECLTLATVDGFLDFKMLMSVSKKISKLELETEDDELNCENLEQTDLRGLKLFVFNQHKMFNEEQITHIMTELEARPDFVVKYKGKWSVGIAERLAKWLTLPNLQWDFIEATSDEEYHRAVQLCTNNCIALNKVALRI